MRTHSHPISSRPRSSSTASSSATSTTAATGGSACPGRRTGSPRRPRRCARRRRSARRPGSARHAWPASATVDAGPRARGRPGARLHVGRRRPVRDVPARAPRRGGREGRVDAAPRPGAARLPRRLRRHRPVAQLQRDQPRRSARSRSTCRKQPGSHLVHRLIDWADVVVDNFRPGVMGRFGLGAEALLERRPDLLVVSSSANGSTGPEALAAGLASIFGATGGLSRADGLRRRPTDRDRRVDRLPQRERARGRDPRRRCSTGRAPARASTSTWRRARSSRPAHRTRCSPTQLGVAWDTADREPPPRAVARTTCTRRAGDDEWVAIAVGDDDEWAALCRVLDRPEWSGDYPTADGAPCGRATSSTTRSRRGRARRSAREAFDDAPGRGRARRWR